MVFLVFWSMHIHTNSLGRLKWSSTIIRFYLGRDVYALVISSREIGGHTWHQMFLPRQCVLNNTTQANSLPAKNWWIQAANVDLSHNCLQFCDHHNEKRPAASGLMLWIPHHLCQKLQICLWEEQKICHQHHWYFYCPVCPSVYFEVYWHNGV